MYRHCIFCSRPLGRNQALESFPVGQRLAFDAGRGRLWAVCPRCGRWNLAPLEERWEAIEDAEKLFRDSRLRVHRENIGLARLPDGTHLIRVGRALPHEFAAWRYGDELLRRRRRTLLWGGAAAVAGTAAMGAGMVVTAGVLAAYLPLYAAIGGQVFNAFALARHQRRVLGRLPGAAASPDAPRLLRLDDLFAARLVPDARGEIALEVPDSGPHRRVENAGVVRWVPPPPLRLEGEEATRVVARTLVHANRRGGTPRQLEHALRHLGEGDSREQFLRRVAQCNAGLFAPAEIPNHGRLPNPADAWRRFVGSFRGERIAAGAPVPTRSLPREELLALEMALHEESERRALEGELATLRAAWREAEEIAAIADALPDDPLERLRPSPPAPPGAVSAPPPSSPGTGGRGTR